MSFDFNDAEQSKPRDSLIPHGTAVPVQMTVRPGGAGDGGWLKRSNSSDALMIDAEFTVVEGEFTRRKFWSLFTVAGETDGQKKAAEISRSNMRAMLESARGIEPSDNSEKAIAARRISGYEDLDGLRFWCVVKLEKGTNGYKDKNVFSYAITPDRKEWSKLEQTGRSASGGRPAQSGAQASAPRATGGKPSWATGGGAQRQPDRAASRPDLNDDVPF